MATGVPLAVSPSTRSPGLFLKVDLLAGVPSPGSAAFRCLLVAEKAASGTITSDTELVQAVGGPDDVATLLGVGTPGHLAAKALFAEHGLALLDVISPAPSGGSSAEQTITFATGPATVTWDVEVEIAGRTADFQWLAGETDTQAAAKCAAAINSLAQDSPVTAASALGVCTVTAKIAGDWGNDITISAVATNGATGTVTVGGAKLAGGSNAADPTTALSNVESTEYAYILLHTSNAEAADGTASSAPGILKAHIDGLDEGRNAKLQQAVYACTTTPADAKAGTANLNHGPTQCIFANAFRSLPVELAAAEIGARIREESLDPAANRIETNYRARLYPPADLNADALTEAEVEDLLQSGVTPVTYDSTNTPRPSRPITTYFKDSGSNADDRLLDTSRVTGTYAIARDLRVAIPAEFPNAKLSPDLEPGEEENPEGVVEERDVRSFVIGRLRFWTSTGVARRDRLEEAITNGTLVVRVNPSDVSQCDIAVPVVIVPPLAKFSLVVQHTGP